MQRWVQQLVYYKCKTLFLFSFNKFCPVLWSFLTVRFLTNFAIWKVFNLVSVATKTSGTTTFEKTTSVTTTTVTSALYYHSANYLIALSKIYNCNSPNSNGFKKKICIGVQMKILYIKSFFSFFLSQMHQNTKMLI